MNLNQDEWVNATELRLSALANQLKEAADVLSSLCQELSQAADSLMDAKVYQLNMAPKAEPSADVRPFPKVQPAPDQGPEQTAPQAALRTRRSFNSMMADLKETHGEELHNYVLAHMIGPARTVEAVEKAMRTFMGTFQGPEEAAEKALSISTAIHGVEEDPFVAMARHRYRLVHADGRVSLWSNYIAPGDLEDVDLAENA